MTAKNKVNVRINKVYTRRGDFGKTSLIGGEVCWKDDLHVEAYGTIDELNTEVGYCIELLKNSNSKKITSLIKLLKSIQNELFNLGSQLAAKEKHDTLPKLSKSAITSLERAIDNANEKLPELHSFVLPGGSIINSQFHRARNICRRAERRTVSLSKKTLIYSESIQYLNRLSDAFFVWSRWISNELGDDENLWKPNR